jgi:hypothetical protein
MGGRWSNSWELLKASWRVLLQHKQLVVFPVISGITMVVLVALLLIPASLFISVFHHTATTATTPTSSTNTTGMLIFYLAYFVVYFIGSFVVIFFNTGLIGAIIGGAIGFAWNMIVLFVIPVMIFQGFGVIDSVKESASLFKRKWGETLISNVGIGFVFGLLAIVGGAGIALAAFTRNIPLILIVSSIALVYWIFLAIMHATLNGILATALYDFAITNQVPQGYDPERFVGAFQPRQARGFFS